MQNYPNAVHTSPVINKYVEHIWMQDSVCGWPDAGGDSHTGEIVVQLQRHT
jgi:hypothetical protein